MLINTDKDKINNKIGWTMKNNLLFNLELTKKIKILAIKIITTRISIYNVKQIENNVTQHIQEDMSEVVQFEGCTGKNFCNKSLSSEVIKLTRKFSGQCEKNKNIHDTDSNIEMYNVNNSGKYILWQEFIKSNRINDTLPKNYIVEKELNIGKREREKYRDMAVEEGFLLKVNDRVFKLNVKGVFLNEI